MLTSLLLGKFIPLLLKIVVGPLTYLIGRILLNAWRSLEELNPAAKRFVIFVLALLITAVLQVTGQQIPGECSGLASGDVTDACVSVLTSGGFLSALITAGLGSALAFIIHAAKKADPRT